MIGFKIVFILLYCWVIISGDNTNMGRLTPQTFQTAYNGCSNVTRQQIVELGMSKFGFSSEYMKIIIGTTEREWYPLDLYLEYEWACCFIDYRVMNYNTAFATDEGAYNALAQWLPVGYYSRENIQNGFDTVTQDTLKAIYLAILYLDKNTFACSGGPYDGCYVYYQSQQYPDIMVWYIRGQPIIDGGITFTQRKTPPDGTFNPCYMTNLYGASWTDNWNTCIYGEYPPHSGTPVYGANVLANCTGYAQGRALEIYNECMNYNPTQTQTHPFVALNADAGLWYGIAQTVGLAVNATEPSLGAIVCWGQVGKEGHVGVVEQIIDANTIITTESGFGAINGKTWIRHYRYRGNGSWKSGTEYTMGDDYYLNGFILNPANPDTPIPPQPIPEQKKSKMWVYMKSVKLKPWYSGI